MVWRHFAVLQATSAGNDGESDAVLLETLTAALASVLAANPWQKILIFCHFYAICCFSLLTYKHISTLVEYLWYSDGFSDGFRLPNEQTCEKPRRYFHRQSIQYIKVVYVWLNACWSLSNSHGLLSTLFILDKTSETLYSRSRSHDAIQLLTFAVVRKWFLTFRHFPQNVECECGSWSAIKNISLKLNTIPEANTCCSRSRFSALSSPELQPQGLHSSGSGESRQCGDGV